MIDAIKIDREILLRFCSKWKIAEMSLFGSVLRDDFGPDSDIDVLVELAPHADLSLFDWVAMQDELESLFSRPVDLVSKQGLRNPYRRKSILGSREIVYAA